MVNIPAETTPKTAMATRRSARCTRAASVRLDVPSMSRAEDSAPRHRAAPRARETLAALDREIGASASGQSCRETRTPLLAPCAEWLLSGGRHNRTSDGLLPMRPVAGVDSLM